MGGMFNKVVSMPVPFWLYYFQVDDLDLAIGRVTAERGQIMRAPFELWSGIWIAHCLDAQGAAFALQGKRNKASEADAAQSVPQIGFSAKWGGISSRGRLLGTKPKDSDKHSDKDKIKDKSGRS
jgi:uncharacterized protein